MPSTASTTASTRSTSPSIISSSPLTQAEHLDAQIAAALDEISALHHRKQTLSAHILSQPPPPITNLLNTTTTTITSNPSIPSTLAPGTTQTLRARSAAAHTLSRRATYRLCTSATTFQTYDPDPGAVDGGAVLGIRIDCFSVAGRAFAAGAYYIFLNRPPVITTRKKGETGAQIEIKRSWVLHRHTLPPFVPVKELCARYLTAAAVVPRDLNVLVGVLRRYVSSYHRREDAIVQLGRDNKAFVARVTMPDAEGLEARVYLKGDGGAGGGGVVDIRFDEGGGISSVRARDDVGRRIYALERKVKGAGRVERVRFGEG